MSNPNAKNITPTFVTYVIATHPAKSKIFLLKNELNPNQFELPGWESANDHFWQTVEQVNQIVLERWALVATVLQCVALLDYPDQNRYVSIYEIELQDRRVVLPPGGIWVEQELIDQSQFRQAEHLEIISQWLTSPTSQLTQLHESSRTWTEKGWFQEATHWFTAQLAEQACLPSGPIKQLRTWERSCVLYADTTKGRFYFKAVPNYFAHEIAIIEILQAKFPANLPHLLGLEQTRHWMWLAEFGASSLAEITDPLIWQEACRSYARLQIEAIAMQADLREAGCPEWPLSKVLDLLDDFMSKLVGYVDVGWYPLSQNEIENIQALTSQLKATCTELAAYNLPATFEHGDFWPGNIIAGQDRPPLYFDWSDSAISHPFFSMGFIKTLPEWLPSEKWQALNSSPDFIETLYEVYLLQWQSFGTPRDLKLAFKLAQKLAPLYRAMHYHYQILPFMKARWQQVSMVAFYLRKLLQDTAN